MAHCCKFWLLILLGVAASGCENSAAPIVEQGAVAVEQEPDTTADDVVTWRLFEGVLVLAETATVRELFSGVGERLAPGKPKDWYADIDARVEEFDPIEEWLRNIYMQPPNDNRTVEDARKLLEGDVLWKTRIREIESVSRAYQVSTVHATEADRKLNWGNLVYFTIFTDTDGRIVCWEKVE